MGDAAINGVLEPGLSLVGDRDGGLKAVGQRQVHEQLPDIASPKDLVDGGEVGSTLLVAEVGCEDATGHALPPEKLAGTAGRPKTGHDQSSRV